MDTLEARLSRHESILAEMKYEPQLAVEELMGDIEIIIDEEYKTIREPLMAAQDFLNRTLNSVMAPVYESLAIPDEGQELVNRAAQKEALVNKLFAEQEKTSFNSRRNKEINRVINRTRKELEADFKRLEKRHKELQDVTDNATESLERLKGINEIIKKLNKLPRSAKRRLLLHKFNIGLLRFVAILVGFDLAYVADAAAAPFDRLLRFISPWNLHIITIAVLFWFQLVLINKLFDGWKKRMLWRQFGETLDRLKISVGQVRAAKEEFWEIVAKDADLKKLLENYQPMNLAVGPVLY
jgi:hypothetical protein